jgi:hypothetical protein
MTTDELGLKAAHQATALPGRMDFVSRHQRPVILYALLCLFTNAPNAY